jgi:hypothetical protein
VESWPPDGVVVVVAGVVAFVVGPGMTVAVLGSVFVVLMTVVAVVDAESLPPQPTTTPVREPVTAARASRWERRGFGMRTEKGRSLNPPVV